MGVISKRIRLMSSDSRRLNFSISAEPLEDPNSVVTIPPHEIIHWRADSRDWRRVKVVWCGKEYFVSRTAWEAAEVSVLHRSNSRRY